MNRQLNCPKCGKWGQVSFAGEVNLTMVCSSCNTKWQILNNSTCPICEKVNNYPKDGTCLKCYMNIYNEKRKLEIIERWEG